MAGREVFLLTPSGLDNLYLVFRIYIASCGCYVSPTPPLLTASASLIHLLYCFFILFSYYTSNMVFISGEVKHHRRSSSASTTTIIRDAAFVKVTVKPGDDLPISPVRSVPTRSYSKLLPRKTHSTALVDEFIQSFKELESYK